MIFQIHLCVLDHGLMTIVNSFVSFVHVMEE